jgi:transcriptional regulator GlxA family with amidase domain
MIDYIMPMARRIIFLVYDGFELLDLAGPMSVFATATALSPDARYETKVCASAEKVTCSSAVTLAAEPFARLKVGRGDTVLVVGAYGEALRVAMRDADLAALLRVCAAEADRYGSICTGAFVLAAAGVSQGKRIATHWRAVDPLRRRHPELTVENEALYVADGSQWTSAGVTTGIDMALAMVRADHGPTLSGEVAKQLVVYAHRPGHQSQFSGITDLQSRQDALFADLLAWLPTQLANPPSVADMAQTCGMSERSFNRRFKSVIGMPPGHYLEDLRIAHARALLESGESVKRVAAMVGFSSEAAFRTRFGKHTGIGPAHYSRMHRTVSTHGSNDGRR